MISQIIKEAYVNITRGNPAVRRYVRNVWFEKRRVRKSLVVKPILSSAMNSRCQVDLIDMQSQPDGDYKWIMVYQDHLTKFIVIQAQKTKRAEEVACNVVDIFCLLGSPHILHPITVGSLQTMLLRKYCKCGLDVS